MSAGVVARQDLAVDVEQGNLFALHIDQSSLAGLDLICVRYFHKVGHLWLLRDDNTLACTQAIDRQ